MSWIEVHQALPNHPKTLQAAQYLGVDGVKVVGHLVCLWLWALDNAPTGDLTGIDKRVISAAAQWFKKPERFIEGLIQSGFLDLDGNSLTIHDWYQYAGRLIERRKVDADRKRKSVRNPSEAPPEIPRKAVGNSHDTVPNRTQPNHTPSSNEEGTLSEAPQWLLTLRAIPGWDTKGVSHEETLKAWAKEKGHSEDVLERSAIGLAGAKQKTLSGYNDLASAFQGRINRGFDIPDGARNGVTREDITGVESTPTVYRPAGTGLGKGK